MKEDITFSGKITEKDLFDFNIYHAYTSSQGIVSIVIAILLIAVDAICWNSLSSTYKLVYPLVAAFVVAYIPVNLKIKAKAQINQPVFQAELTYTLTKEGIKVSSPASEEAAILPWEYIYKIVKVRENIYVFSNRVNAYIIPKYFLKEQYDEIVEYFKENVKDYKLSLK